MFSSLSQFLTNSHHKGIAPKVVKRARLDYRITPWTASRSNQSILKEINPEYSLEGLMLKVKLQYFGHVMRTSDSLEKNPDSGKDEKNPDAKGKVGDGG